MTNDNAPLSEADRLAEIQARLDAVVPAGPWEIFDHEGTTNIIGEGGGPYVAHIGNSSWPGTEEMAMFIANSPADIKFLLGLVRVLEGQLATARRLHTEGSWVAGDYPIQWDEEGCVHCRQEWPCATAEALGLDGGGSSE